MEHSDTLLMVLLLALLLASWLLGYNARGRDRARRRLPPDPDYFVGLNYLLNDEPDDAIDVFIAALEVSAATFDTHLALGKLLRRRGKVDRAIEHYQQLLASPAFNAPQLAELRLQLLRCYIAAGLLDRAEQLLLELRKTSSTRKEALQLAIMLYQTEREWRPALDAAAELLPLTSHPHDLLLQMSHFHCELAEIAIQRQEPEPARAELQQALALFKGNARVYLLAARIENAAGAAQEALGLLYRALQTDPSLFGEIAPLLQSTAEAAGRTEWLPLELAGELVGDPDFCRALAQQQQQLEQKQESGQPDPAQQDAGQGGAAELDSLLQGLRQAPSLPLLRQALQAAVGARSRQDEILDAGAEVLTLHLQSLPRFRCEHCGFELRNRHWACPGCSCWGMVKPISTRIASTADCTRTQEPRVSP